ncbi:hypothetical protein AVEN_28482-1 [Araneus ventricosus]|uniref:Uncharacterized protein n=1 Tax=Araneus ventricosus TaxID=182803 RepID=A0A4Y2J2H8_ARAVE|nr:hypothetical protein AVEN_28482-1 [Araneus ventricosus]
MYIQAFVGQNVLMNDVHQKIQRDIKLISLKNEGFSEFLGLMDVSVLISHHRHCPHDLWLGVNKSITTSELLITGTGRFSMCLDTGDSFHVDQNNRLIVTSVTTTSGDYCIS